jgi:hypothetical protein
MSGDWKPGTIAMIRDKSTSDRSEWQAVKDEKGWFGTDPDMGWVSDADVTDVRPPVVLDLGLGRDAAAAAVAALSSAATRCPDVEASLLNWLADQIEAQTKPPRIPEPGLWGVVEAGTSKVPMVRRWVRYGTGWRDAFGGHEEWDNLLEPVLVREGVA